MNRVKLSIFGILLVASGKLIADDFIWQSQQQWNQQQMLFNQQRMKMQQNRMRFEQQMSMPSEPSEPFDLKKILGHGQPYKPYFNEED